MTDRRMKTLILTGLFGLGIGIGLQGANAQSQNIAPAEQSPAPRAIQCSAALELMSRAAPRWSDQQIVQQARYFWRNEAERLAQAAGRDTNTEIGQEMGLLAEQAVYNPDALSNQATLCLSDVPGAGNVTPTTQKPQRRLFRR